MSVNDVVAPIGVALIAAVPGVLAYRTASSANRATAAAKKLGIEAGAYERARELYESALDQLQKQLIAIQAQAVAERDISNSLRRQVNALEDMVARLRRQMILAGMADLVEQGSAPIQHHVQAPHPPDPELEPPAVPQPG